MIQASYGEVLEGRQQIASWVVAQKQTRPFTVVDVGGSAIGWSVPIVDCFVDINLCDTHKLQFNIDICRQENWQPVLDYCAVNGKFDYAICTHTLEDIYNPYAVLDMLPQIAKAGIISVPSVKTELNHVEDKNWLGFAHHRYLFGFEHGHILVVPKLPMVEKLSSRVTLNTVEEIRFAWQQTLEYRMFMNNYLGPTTQHVLNNLEQFIRTQQ